MSTCTIRIERLANGYEVEITDPAIAKANDSAKDGKWKDPNIGYAFKTSKEVMAFLSKNLEKALPQDEYTTSFDKAASEGDDE